MKKIYVVGGNGFAKECYQQILFQSYQEPEIKFAGFIGHNGYKVDFKSLNEYFVCDLSEFEFGDDDYAVIGAGMPDLRKKIYYDLKQKKNVKFYTVAYFPYCYISPLIEIGEGNIFMSPCCPAPHVKIGNGNVFNGDIVVGHDVEIGDFNFFGGKTQLLGGVKIGNSNQIGVASVFLPYSKIGDNNKIAPISAVYKGCKNNCIMAGNPALKVGDIENEV
ncbi:hypothetical protein IJ732_06755 [bacterium]|nr:hypothetical protein [bacterium]